MGDVEAVVPGDLVLPGMLHGRVVRPPFTGLVHGNGVGCSLLGVDRQSVVGMPGTVAVVVDGDFVGVVAEGEAEAALLAERLAVRWSLPPPGGPSDVDAALRADPGKARVLLDRGGVDGALAGAARRLRRRYAWPWRPGAAEPCRAVADWRGDGLSVWCDTPDPAALRAELAVLLEVPAAAVLVQRVAGAESRGRSCADDVAADAALLSRAVGRPVRVELSREQERRWEPQEAAQLIDIDGGLDGTGGVLGIGVAVRFPADRAPALALLLTGRGSAAFGDRAAVPFHGIPATRVTVHELAPAVRTTWLRGGSAGPNGFALECFTDELAAAAGVDPVEYRLRLLPDGRAAGLLRDTARQAGWEPRRAARMRRGGDGLLHGQGVAYAEGGALPGFAVVCVAEVAVDPGSGEVVVERVTVGQDGGRPALPGEAIRSISRVPEVAANTEGAAFSVLTQPELLPAVQSVLLERSEEPASGDGDSVGLPSAAAIANAIFDATGVRFREVPFTPERVRAGLEAAGVGAVPGLAGPGAAKRRGWLAGLAGIAGMVAGVVLAAMPFRAAIPPQAVPEAGLYSEASVARGRVLAALGNCVTCHTGPSGVAWAGGHRLHSPFGVITTPNLTPDAATGIGSWSLAAFARAMREGVARDGSLLYPALPYTHFASLTDHDMEALYAFLLSQAPVSAPREANALRFPFNVRPLLAGWNALFAPRPSPFRPDPARSAEWNRGAYLVNGLGHCGACHTPRNALGAERTGARLAGATVDGWATHALDGTGPSPLPWTRQDLFDYLRTGFSANHGPAGGPMAAVVTQLEGVGDADLWAMATFLERAPAADGPTAAGLDLVTRPGVPVGLGARLYDGACAVCHQAGRGSPLFGVRPSLALNSNVHAATPDTLVRVILDGIERPAVAAMGAMPGFGQHLDDAQVAALVRYVRAQFAPGRPAWADVEGVVARLR